MTSLDLMAAQAVHQARLLERAVHDDGPWTMSTSAATVPARRFVTDTGVVFLADFLDGVETGQVSLACSGEMVSVRTIDRADGPATVRWDVSVAPVGSPL